MGITIKYPYMDLNPDYSKVSLYFSYKPVNKEEVEKNRDVLASKVSDHEYYFINDILRTTNMALAHDALYVLLSSREIRIITVGKDRGLEYVYDRKTRVGHDYTFSRDQALWLVEELGL